jgi:hypothetical protein
MDRQLKSKRFSPNRHNTPPCAQPSGVLKNLDRLFPGINLDPNRSIAKVKLVGVVPSFLE